MNADRLHPLFTMLDGYERWFSATLDALYGDLSTIWQRAALALSCVLFTSFMTWCAMLKGVWAIPGAAAAVMLSLMAGYSIPLLMLFVTERIAL